MAGFTAGLKRILFGLLACAAAAPLALAADPRAEIFAGARVNYQRNLRSRNVDERIEALKKLREYPLPDAARMAARACADEEVAVRKAAYQTLLALSGEQAVCDALVELAGKSLAERNGPLIVPPVLAALLSSHLPIARHNAQQLLDDKVAPSPLGPAIVLDMVDALGADGNPRHVLPIQRLSKSRVFNDHFGVRRGVVGALVKIPGKESLDALIGMLDRVGGEARADASQHLAASTGQVFGMEAASWQKWWAGAKDSFEDSQGSLATYRRMAKETEASSYYYGLPLFAERLVFVLDTSGSMSGGRIETAKRELARAISGLPAHAYFGVVIFNGEVATWQRELVPADDKMKQAAILYVNNQGARSSTASYDALQAALSYDTEAIYFLTDGAPTTGKIVAPADIVTAIGTQNKVRRVSIYTIGIAPGFPGSPTDAFLKTLADENHGQYRRIDG